MSTILMLLFDNTHLSVLVWLVEPLIRDQTSRGNLSDQNELSKGSYGKGSYGNVRLDYGTSRCCSSISSA